MTKYWEPKRGWTQEELDILHRRSQTLTQNSLKGEEEQALRLIDFSTGSCTYCIMADCAKEIIRLSQLHALPGLPSEFQGVTYVRGRLVAVANNHSLHLNTEQTEQRFLIVIESNHVEIGVPMDQVHGLRSVKLTELSPELPSFADHIAKITYGALQDGTVILDGHKLINILVPNLNGQSNSRSTL